MTVNVKSNSRTLNDRQQPVPEGGDTQEPVKMTRVEVQPAPEVDTKAQTSPKRLRATPQKEAKTTTRKTGTPKDDVESAGNSESAVSDEEKTLSPRTTTTTTKMGCRGCTPHHSSACGIIYFLVVVGLDMSDLISDWLLYVDVSVSEKGLVYGPPEPSVTHALLAFSVIGSVTFLFEAVNLWWEVFRQNPWLDSDLVSAVIIWIEDLPQIAINVYIAMCREDPISVFQLSKASIILIGLLIRIIISSVKYCNKRALEEASQETSWSRRHVAYRVFIMLGLLINSACAVTVFIFTQTQRTPDGNLKFQVPQTIFEDEYNDQRYFQNVSVFVHHPDFDVTLPTSSTNFRANWIRFLSISHIRDHSDLDISYNYVYEKTATHLNMAFFAKEDRTGNGHKGAWSISECYQMDLAGHQITTVDSATCQNTLFSAQARSVFITFRFIPPDRIFRKLIFGDICFNVKIYQNQICNSFKYSFTDSISNDPTIPSIHYYRSNAMLAPGYTGHLLMDRGTPRFYRNDGSDLQDITEVWKTGWGRCESSGSIAPHFQDSIPMECSNNAIASVTG